MKSFEGIIERAAKINGKYFLHLQKRPRSFLQGRFYGQNEDIKAFYGSKRKARLTFPSEYVKFVLEPD